MADETGLKLALMETPKTGFLATWPISKLMVYLYNLSMIINIPEEYLKSLGQHSSDSDEPLFHI